MRVLHPPASRTRWTLVLLNYQLFVDDTGTHRDAPYQGVAGYLSTGERWTAFNDEWNEALPSDLKDGRFRFAKFVDSVNAGRRDPEQLRPLIDVLKRHVRCGFQRIMHMEGYRRIPEKYRIAVGRPYRFCLMLLLQDAISELNRLEGLPPAERLVTIADNQPGQQPQTLRLWRDWIWQMGVRKRVEPIAFRHRRDFPGLQAADMLANIGYRFWTRPNVLAVPPEQQNEPVLPLSLYRIVQPLLVGATLPPVPHYDGHITYEHLVATFPILANQITRARVRNDPGYREMLASIPGVRWTFRSRDDDDDDDAS